jgi:PDZ domain-containing protein
MVTPTEPDAHGPADDSGQPDVADDPPASAERDEVGGPSATLDGDSAVAPPPPGSSGNGAPEVVDRPSPTVAPPPPPHPAPTRRRRRGRIALGVSAFLLVAFLLGAAFVQLPYFLFKPGSVRDTEPLISISGTEVFPSEGSIGYTTVSLRQATLLGLVQGWLDDDIDVYPRDEILGGRDADENRELNLQMMADSKEVATYVALDRLGYDVELAVGQAVSEVVPDSPADGVIEPGDIITAIDGETFDDPDDLGRLLEPKSPGDPVEVTIRTAPDEEVDLDLVLAAAPDDPAKAIIGVQVAPMALEFEFPFEVEIDTGDVGGPSAGLAFSLALIDDLTPGDLTGGSQVAVTGTISPDGTVGPIGGAGQKAAAARRDGFDLFLVPTDDYDDAVAHAGDDLEVVAVDNIDDALAALGDHGGNVDDLPRSGEAAAAPTG